MLCHDINGDLVVTDSRIISGLIADTRFTARERGLFIDGDVEGWSTASIFAGGVMLGKIWRMPGKHLVLGAMPELEDALFELAAVIAAADFKAAERGLEAT